MILRVNPNRMELLRLRRRLGLARRGHKLLQDKLEEMMRRFLILLKDIDRAKLDFTLRTQSLIKDLLYCRINSSSEDFREALSKIQADIRIGVSTARIMNVKVPLLNIERLEVDKHYDFFKTSGQLIVAVDFVN